jgi:sec-independent protein translocase protein TatA
VQVLHGNHLIRLNSQKAIIARKETHMPFGIQPIHIVIIIVVAFLLFGANKLPEMGRSAGKAITEFRKGAKEMTDSFREEVKQTSTTQLDSTSIAPNAPQAALKISSGRFCIQCGASNMPEARFCGNCGTNLSEIGA